MRINQTLKSLTLRSQVGNNTLEIDQQSKPLKLIYLIKEMELYIYIYIMMIQKSVLRQSLNKKLKEAKQNLPRVQEEAKTETQRNGKI